MYDNERHVGYKIVDQNYKSTAELIRLLVSTAGKGANLLMNIGPQPNGELPATAVSRLQEVGQWMQTHGETIKATEAGEVPVQHWGATTRTGDRLFVHILDYNQRELLLPLSCKVLKAQVYDTKVPVKITKTQTGVVLTFPEVPSGPDYIVELQTK